MVMAKCARRIYIWNLYADGERDNPKDSVALQHIGIYEAKKTAAVFHF